MTTSRGHVRKRGNNYELRVRDGNDPVTGKPRVISRTVKGGTERQAQQALTRLLTELDQGAHRGPDATLGTLLDRWWKHGYPNWAPATRNGYKRHLAAYLSDPAILNLPLSKITSEWLDLFYASLLARTKKKGGTLSPSTVRRVHIILNQALANAVRWGWLVFNPATNADAPTEKRSIVNVPNRSAIEAAVVLVAKNDPDFATLLHLQKVAGLRRAELLGLRWSDVDDHLHVRRNVVVDENEEVVVQEDHTKTGRDRRFPLDARTLVVLEDHRIRAKDRAAALGVDLGDAYLFPRRADDPYTPMRPGVMSNRWYEKRKSLGLDGIKMHAFRHAMCTYLLDNGVPVHDVAARAGHANANVTLAIYTHPTTAGALRAAEVAGA